MLPANFSTSLSLLPSSSSERDREVSLLDKLKGVPTCQRYRRWPSDVTAALFFCVCAFVFDTEFWAYVLHNGGALGCVCSRRYPSSSIVSLNAVMARRQSSSASRAVSLISVYSVSSIFPDGVFLGLMYKNAITAVLCALIRCLGNAPAAITCASTSDVAMRRNTSFCSMSLSSFRDVALLGSCSRNSN
jgi:hypothetical protein